jgi:hypothetical protein
VSQENVEVVRKLFEAVNAGEIEAAFPVMREDVIVHPIQGWIEDPVYRGHGGFQKLTASWQANFDTFHWQVEKIHDLHERVLVLALMSGRTRDAGVLVHQAVGVMCSDFGNNLIGQMRFYATWAEALKAVGLDG